MTPTRCFLTYCCAVVSLCAAALAAPAPVNITWLGNQPAPVAAGVSFGVPWPKGAVPKQQAFVLTRADGKTLPLQTWPLAYWPDGSVKWSGFATVAGPEDGGFTLAAVDGGTAGATGSAAAVGNAAGVSAVRLVARSTDSTLEVDTGRVQVRVPKTGERLIESIVVDGREVARDGQLVAIVQRGPERDAGEVPLRDRFATKLETATLEQSGPVRAVIKLEGKHRSAALGREWLPFTVRLYLHAGSAQIRVVHSFVFDGDQEKDFVRGLGLTFSVPLREEIHNRHVRFAGENGGLWAEPIQPMIGRSGANRTVNDPQTRADVYPQQLDGLRVPNRAALNDRGRSLLNDWAVWADFKLSQPNANGFTVEKRTNPESAWIAAGAGRRAPGFVFVGDVSGGLGLSVKNFWQSYPAALEVRHAADSAAQLTAWLWSPDGPAMDMRHYDTRAHGLDASYEDVQPGFSTAHGVGRTSELTLFATGEVPTREATVAFAKLGAAPPVLVCPPQHYHAAQAFGHWGLEDRSTPVKRAIEERLQATLDFYLKQPDQHHWYGFWDFGDVMHSYDNERHVWRYDLGGMAWANSELGPDMWLWLSFLRTGRADVFRMAEAMTRHTGEVDVYHLGRFAGLGSRHNVRHWGCGAKEARISQAAYRRFYYYLTTDERTGDLMREVLNVDFKTIEFDPMRLAQPITEAEKKVAPTRVRLGPDWFAFVSNWMTEWERTGDTKWRDKILAGVRSLGEMPLGVRTGRNLVFGYDPATGKLFALNQEPGVYNLATIMGGAEVIFDLNLMLDDPQWQKLWLQYCRLYSAPRDVLTRDMTTGTEGGDATYVRDGRLAAYVHAKTGNVAFQRVAVDSLLRFGRGIRMGDGGSATGAGGRPPAVVRRVEGPEVLNPIDEGLGNTNSAAQSGLETIAMLGLVGDALPAEFPAVTNDGAGGVTKGGRGGRGGNAGNASAAGGREPGAPVLDGNFDARNPAPAPPPTK